MAHSQPVRNAPAMVSADENAAPPGEASLGRLPGKSGSPEDRHQAALQAFSPPRRRETTRSQMMRFMMLYKPGKETSAPPSEQEMAEMGKFIQEMAKAGALSLPTGSDRARRARGSASPERSSA
jgi:hypothetical protein